MPGWVVGLFVGFAHSTIVASKLLILDGIHGIWRWNWDWWTPQVFGRGEIATSHQPNECNWKLCVCVSFFLLVQSCRDFVQTNGGPIPSWLEEPTWVHSTGQQVLEVITTSSKGLPNSAHDIGVMSECERGIAQRNWRCNFCRATAWMKPSVSWKNKLIQTPSQTHANVESEWAGGKLEYVWGVVCNTERIICWPALWALVC